MIDFTQVLEAARKDSEGMSNPEHFVSSVEWIVDCVSSEAITYARKFLDECEHGSEYGQEAELELAARLVRRFLFDSDGNPLTSKNAGIDDELNCSQFSE